MELIPLICFVQNTQYKQIAYAVSSILHILEVLTSHLYDIISNMGKEMYLFEKYYF